MSYLWDNGLGAGANQTVTPSVTTTYSVTVTNANGCTDTDQVTVTVNPFPTANAGSDQTICAGQSVSLTASGGTNYAWSNGLGNGANQTVSPTGTTTYTVTVTNGTNCADTDEITITVNQLPLAVFSHTQTGGTVSFSNASPLATGWFWNFGDGATSTDENPVHTFNQSGTYTVCLISTGLCGADTIA